MANEPILTIDGNLTADPELRFTPSGAAVANLTVANTPRTFDRQSNEWKDGETLFMRCNIWREMAENAADTLTKGMAVTVTGMLKARSFDTKEGDKRTVMELEVTNIGPSLKYASAKVTRVQRGNGQGNGQGQQQQNRQQQGGGQQQNRQQNQQSQQSQQSQQQGGGWDNQQDAWSGGSEL